MNSLAIAVWTVFLVASLDIIYQPVLQGIHHLKRKRSGCSALVVLLNLKHVLGQCFVLFLVRRGIGIIRLREEFLFVKRAFL